MMRTDVSEPNDDPQGRARLLPPLIVPRVPPMAWRSMTTSPQPPREPAVPEREPENTVPQSNRRRTHRVFSGAGHLG
jgi:hypothetical protein